jgi:hypothetical protein
VDTAYVDGDTRLKIRTATYQSAPCVFENGSMSMSVFSGMTIKCEHPNSRSYGFEGAINVQVNVDLFKRSRYPDCFLTANPKD